MDESLAKTLAYRIDFSNRTATLFGEGETNISTSTWPGVSGAPVKSWSSSHNEVLDRSCGFGSSQPTY